MNKALEQANKALLLDEVPIGAVLVDNITSEIISSSFNLVKTTNNATSHAEMLIINKSSQIKKNKFLQGTSIFVTLEPCAMCAAAISEMRIEKIYFGAYDEKKGSLESIMKIYNQKHYFVPEIYGGINEKACSDLLKNFFILKRSK
jgi:tRNA(Arg) A34 adenosine deaminase TadA